MENHPPTPLFIVKFVVNRGFDKYQAWLGLLFGADLISKQRQRQVKNQGKYLGCGVENELSYVVFNFVSKMNFLELMFKLKFLFFGRKPLSKIL